MRKAGFNSTKPSGMPWQSSKRTDFLEFGLQSSWRIQNMKGSCERPGTALRAEDMNYHERKGPLLEKQIKTPYSLRVASHHGWEPPLNFETMIMVRDVFSNVRVIK